MPTNNLASPIATRTRARIRRGSSNAPSTASTGRINRRGRHRIQTTETGNAVQPSRVLLRFRRNTEADHNARRMLFATSPYGINRESYQVIEGVGRIRTRSITRQQQTVALNTRSDNREIGQTSETGNRARTISLTRTNNRRTVRRALFPANPLTNNNNNSRPMQSVQRGARVRIRRITRRTLRESGAAVGIANGITQQATEPGGLVFSSSNLTQTNSTPSTIASTGEESAYDHRNINLPIIRDRGFFEIVSLRIASALNRNRLDFQDLIAGSFDSQIESRNPLMCNICMQPYQDRQPTVIKCGHIFCRECIVRHLENSNPLCLVCKSSILGTFLKRLFP